MKSAFAVRRWLTGLLAICLLAACQKPPLVQQESYVFGTQVDVTVAGLPEAEARLAIAEVLAEFDRLHRLLHAWQPSELTRLNDAFAEGRAHQPPPEVRRLIEEAAAVAVAGDYLFDPGIGRLVALWGFHADEFRPALPDPVALAAWKAAPGSIRDLRFEQNGIRSVRREVALDLGGYAKGVALDRAADALRRRGVHNALINIGGNVMALGDKNGTPWRIGIRHPRASGFLATLELRDGEAIGTSGDYQRYFELDGRRYSHLLDPRTSEPATGTQALSVLISPGPSPLRGGIGMRSDALSKPLFVAGADRWLAMASRLGVAQALRVDADGTVTVTAGLASRLTWPGGAAPPRTVTLPPAIQ